MKRFACLFILTLGVLAGPVLSPAFAAARKELCLVCKVKEGATALEEVKATRTHNGVEYGFCSESCAKEFEADPAAYVVPDLPRPAPDLTVKSLDGKDLSWKSYEGQVVLVDFWATWCAPCRKSMPELQAIHQRYKDKGFQVLGVSIDEGGADKVKKYVKAKKIAYPIALDVATWERLKVKAVPAAFLVDGQGRIVAQWTGAVDTKDVEAKVAALLGATTN